MDDFLNVFICTEYLLKARHGRKDQLSRELGLVKPFHKCVGEVEFNYLNEPLKPVKF